MNFDPMAYYPPYEEKCFIGHLEVPIHRWVTGIQSTCIYFTDNYSLTIKGSSVFNRAFNPKYEWGSYFNRYSISQENNQTQIIDFLTGIELHCGPLTDPNSYIIPWFISPSFYFLPDKTQGYGVLKKYNFRSDRGVSIYIDHDFLSPTDCPSCPKYNDVLINNFCCQFEPFKEAQLRIINTGQGLLGRYGS